MEVFLYSSSSGFSNCYLNTCLRLLDSKIYSRTEGYAEGIKEMIAIGFAVMKLGLKWRALPYSHDYVMLPLMHSAWYKEELLRAARIVHYHDSMWPAFFPVFQGCLKRRPEVETWLASMGPMRNEAPLHWRCLSRLLNKSRAKQETAYRRKSTPIEDLS